MRCPVFSLKGQRGLPGEQGFKGVPGQPVRQKCLLKCPFSPNMWAVFYSFFFFYLKGPKGDTGLSGEPGRVGDPVSHPVLFRSIFWDHFQWSLLYVQRVFAGPSWPSWCSRFSWSTGQCGTFFWSSSQHHFLRATAYIRCSFMICCVLGHTRYHRASWSCWTERRQGQSPCFKIPLHISNTLCSCWNAFKILRGFGSTKICHSTGRETLYVLCNVWAEEYQSVLYTVKF